MASDGSVRQCGRDRAGGYFARGQRGGDVVGIGRGSEAGNLGKDRGAPPLGVLHRLKYQHCRTFRHHESVAIRVERARRSPGVVVARGEDPDHGEGSHRERRKRGFSAAGKRNVHRAIANRVEGLTDGDRP
jgi:hypothetical protein